MLASRRPEERYVVVTRDLEQEARNKTLVLEARWRAFVERLRLDAPLNDQRPEGYYGSSPVGYTDYPFIGDETVGRTGESDVID